MKSFEDELKKTYGETSDEVLYLWIKFREVTCTFTLQERVSIFDEEFISFIHKKF